MNKRISELWADPNAGLPDHTPETCLSALMTREFTHGEVTSHRASECVEPPPTLEDLAYAANQPAGTDARTVILAHRARKERGQ